MGRRSLAKEASNFNASFLDLCCCALGGVILLMVLLVPVPNTEQGNAPPPYRSINWSLQLPVASLPNAPPQERRDMRYAEVDLLLTFMSGEARLRLDGGNPISVSLGERGYFPMPGSKESVLVSSERRRDHTGLSKIKHNPSSTPEASLIHQTFSLDIDPDNEGAIRKSFELELSFDTPKLVVQPGVEAWTVGAVQQLNTSMLANVGNTDASSRHPNLQISVSANQNAVWNFPLPLQLTARDGGLGLDWAAPAFHDVWDRWVLKQEPQLTLNFMERVSGEWRYRLKRSERHWLIRHNNGSGWADYYTRAYQFIPEIYAALLSKELPLIPPQVAAASKAVFEANGNPNKHIWTGYWAEGDTLVYERRITPPGPRKVQFRCRLKWTGRITILGVEEDRPPRIDDFKISSVVLEAI